MEVWNNLRNFRSVSITAVGSAIKGKSLIIGRQVKRLNKRGSAYAVSCDCNQLIPLSFLKVYGLSIKVSKIEVKSVCCPGYSALVGDSEYE